MPAIGLGVPLAPQPLAQDKGIRDYTSSVARLALLPISSIQETANCSRKRSEILEHPDVSLTRVARVCDPLAIGRDDR
jgi:hypothetical protein